MALFDKFMDFFCDHAAVVNGNQMDLQQEIAVVQEKVGPWVRVKGFTDFSQFFLALHLARAKKHPFSVAYIREDAPKVGSLILKKTDPSIKTIHYSNSQNLAAMVLTVR